VTVREYLARQPAPSGYVIWNHERAGWWAPRSHGYVRELMDAGVYAREDALKVCADARGGWRPGLPIPELAIPVADAVHIEGIASVKFGL